MTQKRGLSVARIWALLAITLFISLMAGKASAYYYTDNWINNTWSGYGPWQSAGDYCATVRSLQGRESWTCENIRTDPDGKISIDLYGHICLNIDDHLKPYYCSVLIQGVALGCHDDSGNLCAAPVDPRNNGCQCPAVGEPIGVATGNVFTNEVDYGENSRLKFSRFYNSASTSVSWPSALGRNWQFNFGQQFYINSDSGGQKVSFARDDGRLYSFIVSAGTGGGGGSTVVLPVFGDLKDKASQATNGNFSYQRASDDAIESFDSFSRLGSITFRDGYTQVMAYDQSGANGVNPSSVTDSFGRVLTFGYQSGNQLTSLTDPAGHVTTYQYNGAGNLVQVTYPDGAIRQYKYANTAFPYALTSLIDENQSEYSTWAYDASGRAYRDVIAGTITSTLNFINPLNVSVTDELGAVHAYAFNKLNARLLMGSENVNCGTNCAGSVTNRQYDANGNLSQSTANGLVTRYVYDLNRNQETSRTEAYGTAVARTVTTTWHPTFNLPVTITEPLRTTTLGYDATGNVTSKTVAAAGKTRKWAYTYATFGRMLTAVDPDNNTSSWTYDPVGGSGCQTTSGVCHGDLKTMTTAKGQITRYTGYDENGNVLSLTDPNGKITTLTRDLRYRLKTRQSGTDLTSFDYWPTGLLKTVTLPDHSVISYSYDAAHRLTGIADSHGNSISYTLDNAGNHTQETVSDPAGQLGASLQQVSASQSVNTGVQQ